MQLEDGTVSPRNVAILKSKQVLAVVGSCGDHSMGGDTGSDVRMPARQSDTILLDVDVLYPEQ